MVLIYQSGPRAQFGIWNRVATWNSKNHLELLLGTWKRRGEEEREWMRETSENSLGEETSEHSRCRARGFLWTKVSATFIQNMLICKFRSFLSILHFFHINRAWEGDSGSSDLLEKCLKEKEVREQDEVGGRRRKGLVRAGDWLHFNAGQCWGGGGALENKLYPEFVSSYDKATGLLSAMLVSYQQPSTIPQWRSICELSTAHNHTSCGMASPARENPKWGTFSVHHMLHRLLKVSQTSKHLWIWRGLVKNRGKGWISLLGQMIK